MPNPRPRNPNPRPRYPRPRNIIFLLILTLTPGIILGITPAYAQIDIPGITPPPDTTPEVSPESPPTPPAPIPAGLESPAATLKTFLTAMNVKPPAYDRASACLDLTDIPPDAAKSLCTKLLGLLNRIEIINYAEHPRKMDLAGPIYGDMVLYTFFPRESNFSSRLSMDQRTRWNHFELKKLAGDLTLELALSQGNDSGGRAWRFSKGTIANLGDLYDLLSKEELVDADLLSEKDLSSALWIEDKLPKWTLDKTLGLKLWQWMGLLLIIFTGVVLDFMLRFLLRAGSRSYIRKKGGEATPETLARTVRPFGLCAAALFWLQAVPFLDLPAFALGVVLAAARLFAILAGVWAAYRVTDLVGEVAASKAAGTATKFDDLIVPLIRKSVKVFITVFGFIYIAYSLDIPIAPLLAGLGIGGAGFAFAAKDTLEHFFGSLTVIMDRPFQVGDWVVINEVEGTVEEVGFRSTRIRTFYNSLVTVPNGNLVRAVVDNFGKRKYRRWRTHVNITYDTPPDKITAFCEGIRELVRLHPFTRKDYYQVWLHQFGPHSLDILIYIFHEAPDWQTELRERERMMLDIIRLANHLGVEFAFPTQTLHVAGGAGVGSALPGEMSPGGSQEQSSPSTDFSAIRTGRRAARDLTSDAAWKERKPGPYRFRGEGEVDESDDSQIESKGGGSA